MQKNGRLVALKYYHIDEELWRDSKMLFIYRRCHYRARVMKTSAATFRKIKNLPNISFHMELQLINSGITDELMLRKIGAKEARVEVTKNK